MTTTSPSVPAAFTSDDFAANESRGDSAVEKGLSGVIVTPRPDVIWLLGYRQRSLSGSPCSCFRRTMSRPCLSPFLSGLRHHANGLHGEPTTEIREIHEVVRLAYSVLSCRYCSSRCLPS